MNLQDLKEMKKKANMTNAEISELSGIPVSTVNKIFSGITRNPRYATLLAIEKVLATKDTIPFPYNTLTEEPKLTRESAMPYAHRPRQYGEGDIEALPESSRAELIHGVLYGMAVPSRMHQWLVSELLYRIKSHIRERMGDCQAYTSPFDVRLFGDDSVVVQPDILVICHKEILTDKGCSGAPDWLIEVVSFGNSHYDYFTKLLQYQKSGVREYWIVDPFERKVSVMNFENPPLTGQFSYEEEISSGVLEAFSLRMAEVEEMF